MIAEHDAMEAETGEAVDQTAATFTQVCMHLNHVALNCFITDLSSGQ